MHVGGAHVTHGSLIRCTVTCRLRVCAPVEDPGAAPEGTPRHDERGAGEGPAASMDELLARLEEEQRAQDEAEADRERFFGLGAASGSQMAPGLGPVVGRGAAYNYEAIRQAGQQGVETGSAAASRTGRARRP